MQFPITLQNSDTFILYDMPTGKPDPRGPCGLCALPSGSQRPARVLQASTKDNTCWYYAMNFLRQRVGKNPCEIHQSQREVEIRISHLRKERARYERSLPACATQLYTKEGESFKKLDATRVSYYLKNEAMIRPLLDTPEALDGGPSLFPMFQEFIAHPKGSKNMWEFLMLKSYGGRIHIHETFLEKDQLDSEEKGKKSVKSKASTCIYSPQLLDHSVILEQQVRERIMTLYQLGYSSWKPAFKIEGLIEVLKNEGPLGIGGLFGNVSYIDAPFEMRQKIQNKSIYAWRPQARRRDATFKGHMVLLVGATQEGDKAYIYFIDPEDASDAKSTARRIYMISYRNFEESVCSVHGEVTTLSSHPYAYRGRFIKDAP